MRASLKEVCLKDGVVEAPVSEVLIALTLQVHWTGIEAEEQVVICTVTKGM